jgi:hypothetical protein
MNADENQPTEKKTGHPHEPQVMQSTTFPANYEVLKAGTRVMPDFFSHSGNQSWPVPSVDQ